MEAGPAPAYEDLDALARKVREERARKKAANSKEAVAGSPASEAQQAIPHLRHKHMHAHSVLWLAAR